MDMVDLDVLPGVHWSDFDDRGSHPIWGSNSYFGAIYDFMESLKDENIK